MRVVLAASRRSILLPFYFGFQAASNSFSGCICKQCAQRGCTPYGKTCFQATHSLFKRYLLDSFRARRYHAWAACLLGGWLLA